MRTSTAWWWRGEEYVDGWMDAATLAPIDPLRLADTSSSYARGYAAGAKQYEQAQRLGERSGGGAGYDAE